MEGLVAGMEIPRRVHPFQSLYTCFTASVSNVDELSVEKWTWLVQSMQTQAAHFQWEVLYIVCRDSGTYAAWKEKRHCDVPTAKRRIRTALGQCRCYVDGAWNELLTLHAIGLAVASCRPLDITAVIFMGISPDAGRSHSVVLSEDGRCGKENRCDAESRSAARPTADRGEELRFKQAEVLSTLSQQGPTIDLLSAWLSLEDTAWEEGVAQILEEALLSCEGWLRNDREQQASDIADKLGRVAEVAHLLSEQQLGVVIHYAQRISGCTSLYPDVDAAARKIILLSTALENTPIAMSGCRTPDGASPGARLQFFFPDKGGELEVYTVPAGVERHASMLDCLACTHDPGYPFSMEIARAYLRAYMTLGSLKYLHLLTSQRRVYDVLRRAFLSRYSSEEVSRHFPVQFSDSGQAVDRLLREYTEPGETCIGCRKRLQSEAWFTVPGHGTREATGILGPPRACDPQCGAVSEMRTPTCRKCKSSTTLLEVPVCLPGSSHPRDCVQASSIMCTNCGDFVRPLSTQYNRKILEHSLYLCGRE